ncbi:MAG TPA: HRDC domain-containing protein, partial [Kofleriaceae bacterium]|nr:HRDC domain-containing protein [Kofleriaceae bacterium]
MTTNADLWIRTPDQLQRLVDELSGCRAIGLDTQVDSLHHYTEKVCVIQVASADRVRLIDPLAVHELSPLAALVADTAVVKVVHAGGTDVASLRRDFGFTFRTLFDTAVASRLLGEPEVGLHAMVRKELGVELARGSQREDWSRRPLSEKQEAHAVDDVAHLLPLAARLTAHLAAAERTEWAREEFTALAAVPAAESHNGPDEFRRIKGAEKLSRRQRAVLRELHVWREARAAAADRPPFKIVGPDILLALAAEPPADVAGVAVALASYRRQVGEAGAVFAAIARGLALPEEELPSRPAGERPALPAAARQRVDALRAWREEEAERSHLDPSVVLTQRMVERVAIAQPATLDQLAAVDGLRRWRV